MMRFVLRRPPWSLSPLAPERWIPAAILVGALAVPGSAAVTAPQAGDAPPIFQSLEGHWQGNGTLMGRPAAFEMTWEPALGGRFVRLDFANSFVAEDGSTSPVLTATAYYRVPGEDSDVVDGEWLDSRGMILPLRARTSAAELVTEWGDESTERGRTTYRVVGADRVEVVDEVLEGDTYQLFGQATYDKVD